MGKAHILREIKRTAADNNGVPLGRARFQTETGIGEREWLGVHWARWGDALREAGFSPNQLNQGYTTEYLLDKLAVLTKELGRLPASGDLMFRDARDPKFPNPKTFGRLGSKLELVTKLAGYCRTRAEYQEVLTLCEEYLSRKDIGESHRVRDIAAVMGFVYLVKSGRFYKIGRTNAAGRREYELGIQLPERTRTVHITRTDDPVGIEAYWHKRFEAKRGNGEWFALDADDIAAFKRRKVM
jgi:Meiotically Up-regulated Gene 113 (MUG113) protein